MGHPSSSTAKHGILSVLILAAFAVFSVNEASAQFTGNAHPGTDVFSIAAYGGGFFAASTFAEGAEFENTSAVGGHATFWAHRNVGLRANALWYSPGITEGDQQLTLLGEDPDIFQYSGDLVLRMPVTASANMSWYPYIVGGVGGKTYDFRTLESQTDFAGNVGAGLELRLGPEGRWGLHTEVRDFISDFQVLEVDDRLHDVIWTGGLSVSF